MNSELIPKTKEQVCAADFFCNECDTIERIEEEPLHEIQTYKVKKSQLLKFVKFAGKLSLQKQKDPVTVPTNAEKLRVEKKEKRKQARYNIYRYIFKIY